jgi:hypothetical protein
VPGPCLPAETTFADLAARFALDGFKHGKPRHLGAEAEAIDRELCRRLRCPGCGRRGMEYLPHHKGRNYRVLARCGCGAAEEM